MLSESSSEGEHVSCLRYTSFELLMRGASKKKVTHFTVPVLRPQAESESPSLKEIEIRDRERISLAGGLGLNLKMSRLSTMLIPFYVYMI